jgi:hypothetical protein
MDCTNHDLVEPRRRYVGHALHAGLQPRAGQIAKGKFYSNAAQPPGRGLGDFSFNVQNEGFLLPLGLQRT